MPSSSKLNKLNKSNKKTGEIVGYVILGLIIVGIIVLIVLLILKYTKPKTPLGALGAPQVQGDGQCASCPQNLNSQKMLQKQNQFIEQQKMLEKRKEMQKRDYTAEENLTENLTDQNIVDELNKNAKAVLFYYGDWCGWSKKAKPEFLKAAALVGKDKSVKFFMVKDTDAAETMKQHAIRGYPTIAKFINGVKAAEYEGDRTAASIAEFALN